MSLMSSEVWWIVTSRRCAVTGSQYSARPCCRGLGVGLSVLSLSRCRARVVTLGYCGILRCAFRLPLMVYVE